jgi:hypothetical protein
VTLNHLEALKEIVRDVPAVEELVDNAIMMSVQTYGNLSYGNFHLLKQLLTRFFQDRRVKVSLFLQDGLQNMDGTIVINTNGCHQSPTAANDSKTVPGSITYFDTDGSKKGAEAYESELTKNWKDIDDTHQLGMNLYNKEGRKTSSSTRSDTEKLVAQAKKQARDASDSKGDKAETKAQAKRSTATAELNMLAQMMGSAATETEGDTDSKPMPKLNLFAEDPFGAKGGGGSGGSPGVETITIDGSTGRRGMGDMMAELKFDDAEDKEVAGDKKGGDDDDEDDLLALMGETDA